MEVQALAALEPKAQFQPWKYETKELGPYDALIKVEACGICYSDIHMINDDWKSSKYPIVPGHEIIGRVIEVGNQVTHLTKNERVGIGWQKHSCLSCRTCIEGHENLCEVDYQATIRGNHGGFATHMVTDSRFAFKIPEKLDNNIAPLLCGGITVYAGLKNAGMSSGQEIGVIGIGGLGHMAVLFASHLGNQVTVFTGSEDKINFAIDKLGAADGVLTKNGVPKKLSQNLDIIINTVDSPQPWDQYIRLLGPNGTFCFVGNPGDLNVPVGLLMGKQRRVMGSSIGSRPRITEMLRIAERYNIRPIIEEFPLSDANKAIEKIKSNKIRYRAVLHV